MDKTDLSNTTQRAVIAPIVLRMEMKPIAEVKAKFPEPDFSSVFKEEDDDIDTIMFLTALHVCPLGLLFVFLDWDIEKEMNSKAAKYDSQNSMLATWPLYIDGTEPQPVRFTAFCDLFKNFEFAQQ
ncbi:hypothetical protein CNMCM8927_002778 [Aspergillus lentulus]|uniref:Uncharacterized protein n=1 Tax=Aspergillus lentulus TaxID=293939 RepID=A0AAN5YFU8_ASPLE|nr:hypothetical protein CNMCM8060_002872 [Aspergillus lentulus]KAF4190985.1 hypothetical protein CNMCM8694_002597 [Aspergillus lentulus]KAF4200627.1 hypothetical protein CNMCM8927_002778 [Aspergillus lentulus]